MIHAVCDFCGKDAGRSAFLLTLEPFQNFARYHIDGSPYGSAGPRKSYVMCQGCQAKMCLPNPYHDYKAIQDQRVSYEKHFSNYTQDDIKDDVHRAAHPCQDAGRDDCQEGGSAHGA